MKSIQKEQILRLNCPGYGEDSYLTMGRAKSLDNYDVIIANPVSILHLFDRDPDVLKEVSSKLDEGLTSFTLKNDNLLQSLEADLKKRIFELVSFLERGGLLIYYLCRPFLLQGNSLSMDNYFWLESLAPDTPVENNVRHMSAVSHGRTIDPTDQAERSEFAGYFKQPGLEWNTIIRTDFLTEGYIVLATAGPRKCIAAHLIAGDNGGRILFLPAPYSPDFDRTLIDCINIWYGNREAANPNAEAQPSVMAEVAPPRFTQPDPAFLKPEPVAEQMPAERPLTSSRTNMSSVRASRTGMSAQNPNSSRTGLPPIQKFDSRTSRSQPAGPPDDDMQRVSAEEILESVSAQAQSPGLNDRSFNERATSDIGTAFQTLNDPLPHPNQEAAANSTAADLLKELEDLTPEAGGRNLLKEMEVLSAKPASGSKPSDNAPIRNQGDNTMKPPEGYTYWSQHGGAPADSTAQDFSKPAPSARDEAQSRTEALAETLYRQSEPTQKAPDAAAKAQESGAKPAETSARGNEVESRQTPQPFAPEPHQTAHTPESASESRFKAPQESKMAPRQEHENISNNGEQKPEAKDLMKKMENMTKTIGSEWCAEYSFPDLDELKRDKSALTDSIRQTQAKIAALDNKISQLEGLKNALLGSEGEELMGACSRVFKRLGWNAKPSDMDELLLSLDRPEAIARIVRMSTAIRGSDLAPLAQSVITHWGEHEIEPKGLFVACTWASRPPADRGEPDFSDSLAEFAQKKSLCLMTTMQLLCMYRDLELGKVSAEEIRRRIIETNGRLQGFSLDTAMTKAGA